MARGDGNPAQVFERAVQALQSGQLEKAARDARKLSKMAPGAPDAWSLRAIIAGRMGAHADARRHLVRALQLRPDDPALLNNMGNACAELGDHQAAVEHYERSLAGRPDHADTLMNLGNALMELRRADEAGKCFERVLTLTPGHAGARLNLGGAHMLARRFTDARAIFDGLRADGVDDAGVWNSIYNACVALGDLEAADAALARLTQIAPDDPKMQISAAILHFLRENWAEAWQCYAARWRWKPVGVRPFKQPWWNGEPLGGRKILAWGEQGLGDEIMFATMVPDLSAQAGSVVLECDSRLLPIFQRSFKGVTSVARTERPAPETRAGDIDFQVPTGNLGIWYRADAAAFGDGAPFLVADEARTQALRARYLGNDEKPLVGVAWRSFNADIGDLKSMQLADLARVLSVPGVRFVDLQYGDTATERAAFNTDGKVDFVHDPDIDPTVDLDGHAAQIAAMDLVVSISNTTVHVAGAFGVPTWCLIQKIGDRRWLIDRDDSPWYGSVRLYRQDAVADWRQPVARAAADLAEWAAKRQ